MNVITKQLAMILLVSACACVSTGHLNGRMEIPGQPAEPVVFNFESDRGGQGGKLSALLPDGETFTGKYLQITSTTSESTVGPMFYGWGDPYWSGWGPFGAPWSSGGDYTTFRTNYSGKVIATLFGTKGNTMRCRFNLANPPSGLKGGGTGECQLSKGRQIAVQF